MGNHVMDVRKHCPENVQAGLYSTLGLYGDNGKENGNCYIVYWGYIGIMEKNMETESSGWVCFAC